MASAETFRNHSTQLEMVQHFTADLENYSSSRAERAILQMGKKASWVRKKILFGKNWKPFIIYVGIKLD